MYKKCITECSVLHQRQVENALLELMQKQSYESITVTQLCQSAGITRRIFYHLFTSKTGALYAMIDHHILASGSYRPELSDDALRFFCFWKDHRALLDVLQANGLAGILLERMISCVLDEEFDLRLWLKRNGWKEEKDIIIFHLSGIIGLVYRWYFSHFRESPEEMAALLVKILTTPLTGTPAAK